MTKTMSIRMDRGNYEFLARISNEERSDLSKAVRDLVRRAACCLPSRDTERVRLLWAKPRSLPDVPWDR